MSWFSNLFNRNPSTRVKTIRDTVANRNPGGFMSYNRRLDNALQGSFKKGGTVKKTGIYKLHKGEEVIPAKKKEIAHKMGWNEKRRDWYDKHPNAKIKPSDIPW